MQFRSSTFMPAGCDQPENVVWYEAHQNETGKLVVVQLSGAPRSVGRPCLLKRLLSRATSGQARTIPTKARVLKTVDTPLQALEEVLLREQAELSAGAKFVDIGEAHSLNFGGVRHYTAGKAFSHVCIPEPIYRAVNDYVSNIGFRFLLGVVPRSMLEGAREAVRRYHEHAATPARQ